MASGWGLRVAIWLVAAGSWFAVWAGGAATAQPSAFSVSPSTAVAHAGKTIPVSVQAPAGLEIGSRLYNQDPFTGQLTALRPGQATWLSVSPPAQVSAGRPLHFAIRVGAMPTPPASDVYIDVLFVAHGASRVGTGAGAVATVDLAEGTLVAFHGVAAGPATWVAGLAGPRLVWSGSGTWWVRLVAARQGGWLEPDLSASLAGSTTLNDFGLTLPGHTQVARVVFHGIPPGLHRLRVTVTAGGRRQVLSRGVLAVPRGAAEGAAFGAAAALLALLPGLVRRRRPDRRQAGGGT